MAIMPVIKHPDARLYKVSELFNFERDKELLFHLRDTFRDAQGGKAWGLSLPQIGFNLCAFIMRLHDEPTGNRVETFVINPVITEYSNEKLSMIEGCLSLPWLNNVAVERPIGIKGFFRTGVGDVANYELGGMEARVFQHEMAHLMGITLNTERFRQ